MKTKLLIALTVILATGLMVFNKYKAQIMAPAKYGAVVRLVSPEGITFCTGFVVSATKVMTAGHCAQVETMSIIDENLKFSTPGKFDFVNPSSMESVDVATISGDFSAFDTLSADFRRDAKMGAKVMALGYALGGALHKSDGIVTGFNKFFLQTRNLDLIQGMSGGPLLDIESGVVVGINSRVDEDSSQLFTPMINLDGFTGL